MWSSGKAKSILIGAMANHNKNTQTGKTLRLLLINFIGMTKNKVELGSINL